MTDWEEEVGPISAYGGRRKQTRADEATDAAKLDPLDKVSTAFKSTVRP